MRRITFTIMMMHFLLVSTPPVCCQSPNKIARDWQVQSFVKDANLVEKSVVSVDFTADGSLWLGVSDGLYHFDGYRWSRFTTEHGLPSNYIRYVNVTSDGTLWVATDLGAGTFENGSFDDQATSGKLAGPSVRRIIEDPDGSLWFCCDQWPNPNVSGGLTRMYNGRFTTWTVKNGLPSDYVSDYFRDLQGRQFVLTNKGLAQFSDTEFREPLKDAELWDEETYVWSMVESEQHGLIVATKDHFFRFQNDGWHRFDNKVPGLKNPKLVACDDGEIYTCPDGAEPIIYRWAEDEFIPVSQRLSRVAGGIQTIAEDKYGAIWIGGFERLLRWERLQPEWAIYDQVGLPLLQDHAGGVWFKQAEESDGLLRYHARKWTEFADAKPPVLSDRAGNIWMQFSDSLAICRDGQNIEKIVIEGVEHPQLVGVDGDGVLWVLGKSKNGLQVVTGFDGKLWSVIELPQFASNDGLRRFQLDPEKGIWLIIGRSNLPPFRLLHVDATGIEEIPLPEQTQGNNPPRVQVLKGGKLFLGGFFGLLERPEARSDWKPVELPSGVAGDFKRMGNEVWISCHGHLGGEAALVRYRDEKWESFPDRRGVFVGQSDDREMYVAAHEKIQIIHVDDTEWMPPIKTPFETKSSTVVAASGIGYWVGHDSQSFRYTPDNFLPESEIVGGDEKIYDGEDLVLQVNGLERFKPLTSSRNFSCAVKLDNKDWSPFEALTGDIRIPELAPGPHVVSVRVQDAAGQIDATPAFFNFNVYPIPLQSRPWFRPIVVLCFFTMLTLAVMATINWTKARRLASGLELEVDRKTKRLRLSERKFRRLFEDSQNAICLFGTGEFVQSTNRAANELLGLSKNEPLSVSDIFADTHEENRCKQEIRRKGYLSESRFRIRKKNGMVFEAIVSVNSLTSENGRFQGYQYIIQDISELVQLQESLSKTKKMAALGRMAGGIAHDFNNFLAVVVYGADLIKLSSKNAPNTQKGVQMIVDAAERGKDLTAQIQTFSHASGLDLGVIDTHKVLSGIPDLLHALVPPNIELKIDMSDELGHIYANPKKLEQVIMNLAINACHAMPDGGTLTIQASETDLDDNKAAELRVDTTGPHIQLQVQDSGVGMDIATCEQIFDPFYTTKPSGQGTGLGLAIVYGIIQQFCGRILVQSQLGQGTCFEMYFPISVETAPLEPTEENVVNPGFGNESILVVEDNANFRELISDSLSSFGYEMCVAENVEEAKTIIETKRHLDLVISDVVLVGPSGLDLVNWLRKSQPELPILLISGYPSSVADEVHDEIDVPLLHKPFHPTVLASRVREILNSRLKASNA